MSFYETPRRNASDSTTASNRSTHRGHRREHSDPCPLPSPGLGRKKKHQCSGREKKTNKGKAIRFLREMYHTRDITEATTGHRLALGAMYPVAAKKAKASTCKDTSQTNARTLAQSKPKAAAIRAISTLGLC